MVLRWLNSLALSSLVLSGSLSLLSPRTDSEQHGAQAERQPVRSLTLSRLARLMLLWLCNLALSSLVLRLITTELSSTPWIDHHSCRAGSNGNQYTLI